MGIYKSPIDEIVARMAYHTGAGQLLAAYQWHPLPQTGADGVDDYPSIRLLIPDLSESYRASRHGNSSMNVRLGVAVAKEDGIPALMAAIEAVIDCVEINTSDEVDAGLSGTTMKPVAFRVSTPFATETSLSAPIVIDVTPRPFNRGNRRSL